MPTILIFLLILCVLVVVHEAGHFFVAKLFGIKVEEFGFGFPPRAIGRKIGETIYSLNWLPIGGFVKLFGEDSAGGGKVSKTEVPTKDLQKAFFAKPAWQRALVVSAGVVMNFLLAVLILCFLIAITGDQVPGKKVIVEGVSSSSPAKEAGLIAGDIVVSANGILITSPNELTDFTNKHLGEKLSLVINRKGKAEQISVIPRKNPPAGQGPMGVSITSDILVKKFPWYQIPVLATQEAIGRVALEAGALWSVVFELFTKAQVPQGVAGPVGIAELTGQVAKTGVLNVLNLMVWLSLNLAVLNILPIPALDGGRLFFILFEMITRKKVNQKYENWVHAGGMIVLLSIIALITFHDIIRLLSGQSLLPK